MGDKDEESAMPRDAKIVKSLLKSMGVEGYEPRVIHKFLELWYRYVVDVLTDAQVYSEHAGKSAIDCDDVKLAIQSKVNFSFSQPPPREVITVINNSPFQFQLFNRVSCEFMLVIKFLREKAGFYICCLWIKRKCVNFVGLIGYADSLKQFAEVCKS